MNELITKIQGDSTLMLMAIIALVVLLVIVLTIVVSAMRVKTYKDRWWNVTVDNKEKAAYISTVEQELQASKIKNASNAQELSQFADTKERLKTAQEEFYTLQKNFNELEKELSQTKAKLESTEGMYETLTHAHKELQERNESLLEDNSRYRVNNARLLMKLESEERVAQNMKDKKEAEDKA